MLPFLPCLHLQESQIRPLKSYAKPSVLALHEAFSTPTMKHAYLYNHAQVLMCMKEIKRLQHTYRMSQTGQNNHDMKPLVTSTKDIKCPPEASFWELIRNQYQHCCTRRASEIATDLRHISTSAQSIEKHRHSRPIKPHSLPLHFPSILKYSMRNRHRS